MFDKFKEFLQFLCIMYRNIQIVSGPDVDDTKRRKTTKLILGDVSAHRCVSVSSGSASALRSLNHLNIVFKNRNVLLSPFIHKRLGVCVMCRSVLRRRCP